MKLLIYGAGVIGSLYAVLLSEAGYNTTIYARGERLASLTEHGLLYSKKNGTKRANVRIIGKVENDDYYDYIFLPVRENQVHHALRELRGNISPNIVTMVNTLEPYSSWEELCGKGRIIPAFPGAGGSFYRDVLNAALTPWVLQATTFGEIGGGKTERLMRLANVFKHSKIPYQIVNDMHIWQLCHLAMVVPIADAYYAAKIPKQAGIEKIVMRRTAKQLKSNFSLLHNAGIKLSPRKMSLFRIVPISILSVGLRFIFQSQFGNMFMYQHSMKAPDEMMRLHNEFYEYVLKLNA